MLSEREINLAGVEAAQAADNEFYECIDSKYCLFYDMYKHVHHAAI